MSVEVNRRRGESFDAFLRRFSKKVQMSGRLIQARKIRFRAASTSKNVQRTGALRRVQRQGYYQYLEKIGKLDEELEKIRSRKRGRRR
ncbi:MAG: hypothetical protein Q7T01_04495 [bacterium]|nr:hypothetical protein [bacterium]